MALIAGGHLCPVHHMPVVQDHSGLVRDHLLRQQEEYKLVSVLSNLSSPPLRVQISWIVCPRQLFPACFNICRYYKEPTQIPLRVLHLYRLQPYSKILGQSLDSSLERITRNKNSGLLGVSVTKLQSFIRYIQGNERKILQNTSLQK